MSFATTIGHTLTGVVAPHGGVHLPRRRSAAPAPAVAPAPERRRRTRSAVEVQAAFADNPDLEQWRAAFILAAGFNR